MVKKLPERIKILSHIYQVFSRFCATMKKWTLYEEGQRQRIMIGIVSTPEDLVKNPQLIARHWLQDVEHDHLGGATVRYAGPPYRLTETPWAIRRRPPLPGEHNDDVFVDELGLPPNELDALREQHVI